MNELLNPIGPTMDISNKDRGRTNSTGTSARCAKDGLKGRLKAGWKPVDGDFELGLLSFLFQRFKTSISNNNLFSTFFILVDIFMVQIRCYRNILISPSSSKSASNAIVSLTRAKPRDVEQKQILLATVLKKIPKITTRRFSGERNIILKTQ